MKSILLLLENSEFEILKRAKKKKKSASWKDFVLGTIR